ncbi:TRAP transporter small permease [Pseudomonas paeninsulae]|uniref:TRAP transporter small permease n=1 Tax=Pseudomonas paeninsulae TaxID=3110772 RepID=UPI002D779D7E|nr:TRAP transporter small permease [Pseudomonas sp. IT1137]
MKLGKLWDYAAAGILLALVVITITAASMRYFFDSPLQWTEEVSGLLMIWVVMIGGVAAERDKEHLSISLLLDCLPKKAGNLINLLVSAVSILGLLYMAFLAYTLSMMAQFKRTQILQISWFWIDIAVTVGAIGIAGYLAFSLVGYARELKRTDQPEATSATVGSRENKI